MGILRVLSRNGGSAAVELFTHVMVIDSRCRRGNDRYDMWIPSGSSRGLDGKSGPRLNIKTILSTYGDFHVKDKTAVRTSYL